MLSCPFCNSDFSSVGLRDGRCRFCGVMLEWSEEPVDQLASPESLGPPPAMPRQPPRPRDLPPADEPLEESARQSESQASAEIPRPVESVQESVPGNSMPPADEADESRLRQSHAVGEQRMADPQPLSAEESRQLDEVWKPSLTPHARPGMTIKGNVPATAAPRNLVVPRRVVKAINAPDNDTAEYEILDVIGEGGVGVVFAARQSSIDRTVALKMLKEAITQDRGHQDKFLSEAVVTGDLEHPNIVPIYDLAANDRGDLFYAMKRVQGTPWSDVIQQKSTSENVEILMKICDALAFAHSRGIIHRDLKPENVMLGDFGEVLVMDWGIALSTSLFLKNDSIHQSQSMGGTPAYMAPEMARGPISKIGPASDVYLLGALLYEIVTGNPPHTGANVRECLFAVARNEIQPTDKSGELLDIAYRALATDPADRYGSVQEFQAAIRQYRSHSESIALSTRAEEDLVKAKQSRDYQDFARALFGFEEATALWSENNRAAAGVIGARLAYASCAYQNGDYDLGISLLDPRQPSYSLLYRQLIAGRRERDDRKRRLANFKRIAALLVLTVIAVVTWTVVQTRRSNRLLSNANQALQDNQDQLTKKKLELESANTDLEAKTRLAEAAKAEALTAQGAAEAERERAQLASQREAQSSYIARIGLTAERVGNNAFLDATRLLDEYHGNSGAFFRDWEWGHLRFLCLRDRKTVLLDDRVERIAIARGGHYLAAGTTAGMVSVWRTDWTTFQFTPLQSVTHGGSVTAVALNADGTLLATGGEAGSEIKLWRRSPDGEEYQPQPPLTGHRRGVVSLVFSADGSRLLSSSLDETARLWDVARGTQLKAFRGHFGTVWAAAFAPGAGSQPEERIATAGDDSSVRIWEIPGDKEPKLFLGHKSPVFTVAFDHEGKLVASSGRDNDVLIWDSEQVQSFDFAALKERLDQAGPEAPVLAEVRNDPMLVYRLQGHAAEVRSVAFSANSRLVLSCGHDNTVKLWDLSLKPDSPLYVRTFRGHGGWVRSSLFSPDERYAVSAGFDKHLKAWDVDNYEEARVLRGHDEAISSASFSPDSRLAISGSNDRKAILWDVETGEVLKQLEDAHEAAHSNRRSNRYFVTDLKEGHEFLATAGLFFPNNPRRVLTSAGDNTVRIWDQDTGGQVRRLEGTGIFGAIAVSDDGEWILTGSDNNHALLWEAGNSVPARVLSGHDFEVVAVAISHASSPGDRRLFTGDSNGRGKLWRFDAGTKSWQAYATLTGHLPGKGITAACFIDGDQRLLTASQDRTVLSWNSSTGERLFDATLSHPDAVKSLAVSPDGRRALTLCHTAATAYTLYLWDLEQPKKPVAQHVSASDNEIITGAIFGHDQQYALVTSSSADSSHLWRWTFAADRYEPFWPNHRLLGDVWSVALSPDGTQVLTVGGDQARLRDRETGDPVAHFSPHREIRGVAFSDSGKLVATGSSDGTVKIWHVDRAEEATFGKTKLRLSHAGQDAFMTSPVHSVAFSTGPEGMPEGSQRLLTAGADGVARLWDVSGEEVRLLQEYDGQPGFIARAIFSPNGKQVLTAHQDGTARLWDTESGRSVGVLDGQSDQPQTAAAGSDPNAAAMGSGHRLPVWDARFSADGSMIVTGSDDYTAKVWETKSLRLITTLTGHTARVSSVAFSPSGLRVLTGSFDGTAKLWDVETSKEIITLKRHSAEVSCVAFSPTGRRILTASHDRTAILWLSAGIPPAISLSYERTECTGQATFVQVDPKLLVRDPDEPFLAGGKAVVSLVEEPQSADDGSMLGMRAEENPAGGIRLDGDSVLFDFGAGAGSHVIGTVQPRGDRPRQLTILLSPRATIPAVQAMLRSVTFETSTALTADRRVRFVLEDASRQSSAPVEKTVFRAVAASADVEPSL